MNDDLPALGAEMLGTGMLVFVGCGAIVVAEQTGLPTHEGIALAFGLVVMIAIYTLGDLSGAHINPAVSIAMWLAGRLSTSQTLGYVGAQLAGGLVAAGILRLLFFADPGSLGVTLPSIHWLPCFVLEVILAFILVLVILRMSAAGSPFTGLAVGGVVAMGALFAGPITGASMNPARSIGPALIIANFSSLWLYLLAPIVGGLLAAIVDRVLPSPPIAGQQHGKISDE